MKDNHKIILFKLVILLLTYPITFAQAAFSNYNSILIGDQASGMGGAATAMGYDSSACSWYNPATCALIKGKSLSAAVGIYKKYDTMFGENQDIFKAGLRVNQGFFQALPSSTGSIVHFDDFLPDHTFALSILTPEYDIFKGDLNDSNSSKTTLTMQDESLWVGPSISKKISTNESLGLSVYYTARSYSKSLTDRTFLSSTQTKIYQEEKFLTQNSVVAILGYHYTYDENWKYGFSVRLPCLHVAGSGTYFDTTLDSGTTVSTNSYAAVNSRAHIPAKYTFGVAYEEDTRGALTLDVSYYAPDSYYDFEITNPGVAEYIEHRAIINVSGGMDIQLRDWLRFRLGGFTNFSSHPDPDKTKVRGQGDHVDQLGWAANLSMKSGPINYTFGGYYTGGRGRTVQRINQSTDVTNKTQQVFTMLVGTSYSY